MGSRPGPDLGVGEGSLSRGVGFGKFLEDARRQLLQGSPAGLGGDPPPRLKVKYGPNLTKMLRGYLLRHSGDTGC